MSFLALKNEVKSPRSGISIPNSSEPAFPTFPFITSLILSFAFVNVAFKPPTTPFSLKLSVIFSAAFPIVFPTVLPAVASFPLNAPIEATVDIPPVATARPAFAN